jgi:vacuolar-type H+-ATPase subunit E/Vma4
VSLQGESYKNIVKSYLLQIPKGTKGVVVVSEGRKEDMRELLAELGLDNPIESSSDIKGGFIFSGEHFNYNFSFEHLIKDKKADLEVQISSLLFE